MVGVQPASLGLDPAVYVYSKTGRHQPTSFLGIAAFIKDLEKSNKLLTFLSVRQRMEEFLLSHRSFIIQIVTKRGSGAKGLPLVKSYYNKVMECMIADLSDKDTLDALRKDASLSFLSTIEPDEGGESVGAPGRFTRETKSAAYIRDALSVPLRCAICGGRMQSKSISFDHTHDLKYGGSSSASNAQLTHPYCNSVKDLIRHAAE